MVERIQCKVLFRRVIGLPMDNSGWVPKYFTKSRKCLITHDAVLEFFHTVLAIAKQNQWLSGVAAGMAVLVLGVFAACQALNGV